MAVHVDMTGVTTSYESPPQGYYQAVVEKCENKLTKDGTKAMLKWTFNITEPEEYIGRKVYTNTMLVQSSLWVLKRLLLAIGLGTEESLAGEVEFDEEDAIGLPCTVVMVPHEFEGKATTQVGAILEAGVYEEVEE